MDALHLALSEIRVKATELRESFGDDARARALEWAALRVEQAIRERDDERLTLTEAAARSGYSADHVARLVRDGRLPNVGRHGAPRVRAGDLPSRPGPASPSRIARLPHSAYDPNTDARSLLSRQGER